MAEKGKIDGIDCSPETQRRRKSESYWHMSFLAFSMGLFMCITSSLTMITVIANFAVSYQTRDIIFETFLNDSYSAVPIPYQSSTTPTIMTTVIDELNSTVVAIKEKEKLRKIVREEADLLLTQLNNKATNEAYLCAKSCADPPVTYAKLNLTLPLEGENYIVLEAKVATENEQIAKRRVAYMALDYLHKDNVIHAKYDPVWNIPVPFSADCNANVAQVWRKCKT